MNRINLTRADIRLIQHFKADRILICQRNKIDGRIFMTMHSTITPIFRDTYVTTRPLRTKQLLIKAKNTRFRNARNALSQA